MPWQLPRDTRIGTSEAHFRKGAINGESPPPSKILVAAYAVSVLDTAICTLLRLHPHRARRARTFSFHSWLIPPSLGGLSGECTDTRRRVLVSWNSYEAMLKTVLKPFWM
eukprot:3058431-Rhodomonas_salina.2